MRVKLTIVLEIEGDAEDARYVADELLDSGLAQDWISDHELDAGPLRVTSAWIGGVEEGEP